MQDRQRARAATPKLQHLQFHAPHYVQPITTTTRETEQHKTRGHANVLAGRPAMSTTSRARRGGGGVRQFPVGQRRYVPVVDAGCGCRQKLPSLLKPSGCHLTGGGETAARRSGGGSRYASSTSSSSAVTQSTGYSSYGYDEAAATKQQEPAAALHKANGKKELLRKKQTRKKRRDSEMAEEAAGVGVPVEKESRDPRADFRESMVRMVVEMGLCDWDGLRCMLRRLLALNAPRHHADILAAFAEVCAQIIAASSPTLPSPSPKQA